MNMSRQRTGTLELRKGTWHVRVTVGQGAEARRERWDTATTDRALAKRKAARLIAELAKGKAPERAAETVASERVDDFAEAYFAKREARGIVMVRWERMYYRTRAQETIGTLYLCDVRPQHVRGILEAAIEAGLKRGSVIAVRNVLHRIFGEAWRAELIESSPVARVPVPRMREVVKQRMILTDGDFAQFMTSDKADVEIKMLGLAARTLGGMRASDLVRWDWSMIDRVHFAECFVPRSKTGKPDRLEVPDMVRPFLRARWEQHGCPEAGPVFPIERGKHAGEARTVETFGTFAARLRRNLFAAGVVRMPPVEVPFVKPGTRTDLGKKSPQATRLAPNPRDPLYNETATTLPVDFHSFRRAYNTALAEAGVNVQQAMHLAGHSDPKVHMRYVQQTATMRRIPEAAVPRLPPWPDGAESNERSQNQGVSLAESSPLPRAQTATKQGQSDASAGLHTVEVAGPNPAVPTNEPATSRARPPPTRRSPGTRSSTWRPCGPRPWRG
jgi:integrase